jgi:uncharacterized protein (DUF2062 family)
MPRKYFRRYLPSHEQVRQNRYIAWFGRHLHHPNLWHLNRMSVSGGVAIGLFSGLIPGPLQMLTAALLCVLLGRNLPVALITTLYTNPFTIVPLYIAAYYLGSLLTGVSPGDMTHPPDFDWSAIGASIKALAGWSLSLGPPLAIGLVTLAVSLAVIGWFLVQFAWRAWVVHQWRRRRLRRPAG